MTLRIDGVKIEDLSVDQLGATLQQIASELSVRGNNVHDYTVSSQKILLWAFDQVEEAARMLRTVRKEMSDKEYDQQRRERWQNEQ